MIPHPIEYHIGTKSYQRGQLSWFQPLFDKGMELGPLQHYQESGSYVIHDAASYMACYSNSIALRGLTQAKGMDCRLHLSDD